MATRGFPLTQNRYPENGIYRENARMLITSGFLRPSVLAAMLQLKPKDPLYNKPWQAISYVKPGVADMVLQVMAMATSISISDMLEYVRGVEKGVCTEGLNLNGVGDDECDEPDDSFFDDEDNDGLFDDDDDDEEDEEDEDEDDGIPFNAENHTNPLNERTVQHAC
jgi:hypothetical protein